MTKNEETSMMKLSASQLQFIEKMQAAGWHHIIENDRWQDGCIEVFAVREDCPNGELFLIPR